MCEHVFSWPQSPPAAGLRHNLNILGSPRNPRQWMKLIDARLICGIFITLVFISRMFIDHAFDGGLKLNFALLFVTLRLPGL